MGGEKYVIQKVNEAISDSDNAWNNTMRCCVWSTKRYERTGMATCIHVDIWHMTYMTELGDVGSFSMLLEESLPVFVDRFCVAPCFKA